MTNPRLVLFALFCIGLSACSRDPKRERSPTYEIPYSDVGGHSDAALDASDASQGADAEVEGSDASADAGVDAADVCTPESDEEMCARYGYTCGQLTNVDNCGEERTIDDCAVFNPACEEPNTCGGGGVEGECGCTPRTCEQEGLLCGTAPDGCDGTLTCDTFCVDSISAGGEHACAIGSGAIKCWGSGGSGQLGNNKKTQEKNPVDVVWPQDTMATVVSAGSGSKHTCVVTSAGRVICWGANDRGQLGVGTTVSSQQPGDPAVGAGATQVVSGEAHSCALVNGGVWCWGSNDYGQVGNAGFNYGSNVAIPVQVDGLDANVVAIAAGSHHNCALVDDPNDPQVNGQVYCWGRGRFGQLAHLPSPFIIGPMEDLDVATRSVTPLLVIDGALTISAGDDHSCMANAAREIYCWGFMGVPNQNTCVFNEKNPHYCAVWPSSGGYIGQNNNAGYIQTYFTNRFADEPQKVEEPKAAYDVASGANHVCFLVEMPNAGESNIRCFGVNSFGQIGDGTNNNWAVPRAVFLDTNNNVVTATQISLGDDFTCALVDDSNVKCWGSNASGQIGNSALMRDETYRPFDVKLEPAP